MPGLKRSAIRSTREVLRACVPLLKRLRPNLSAEPQQPIVLPASPRILLLHPGHLGDIVISSSILDPLERHCGTPTIGFVMGSWAAPALEGVEGIAAVHRLDHWRLNRSGKSLFAKWLHYQQTRRRAVREIRAHAYDVAISLLDVNPDLLDVAWSAGVPVRIGWQSSFFAPLATHTVPALGASLQHQAVRQAHTLLALGAEVPSLQDLHSRAAAATQKSLQEVRDILGIPGDTKPYTVVHMGAGAPMKQMPAAFWRPIVEQLCRERAVLFTGLGAKEQQTIDTVRHGLPNCYDACGRLSWRGFVTAIRGAEMLYSVDSMAGHIAAAVGTPVTAVYQGAGGVSRWRPMHALATVFTNHLPCAPCLLPNGCAEMPCRQVSPQVLLQDTQANYEAVPHQDTAPVYAGQA